VDAAEFVAEVARAMGCQVQVAVEWSQFQTLYDLFDPAVIVLDLVMPGVDGVEILGLLGSRAATASIILFSGTDPQTIDSARRLAESQNLRIVGSLSKPADLAQLRALLRTALETSEPGAAPRASPQARSNAHGTATAVDVRRAIFAGEIVPLGYRSWNKHPCYKEDFPFIQVQNTSRTPLPFKVVVISVSICILSFR
jgi:DNA-binding response OmpR family regulator